MLGCDWTWWGLLTNQNHAWKYAEVRGGVRRGMRRYAEGYAEVRGGVHGGMWRYAEGCVEVRGGT